MCMNVNQEIRLTGRFTRHGLAWSTTSDQAALHSEIPSRS